MDMEHPRMLEWIVRDIRDHTARQEGQSIDEFMRVTWAMALAEYEREKPKLINVERALERSAALLADEQRKGIEK